MNYLKLGPFQTKLYGHAQVKRLVARVLVTSVRIADVMHLVNLLTLGSSIYILPIDKEYWQYLNSENNTQKH